MVMRLLAILAALSCPHDAEAFAPLQIRRHSSSLSIRSVNEDQDVQVCLDTLEKRVQNGPGALNMDEIMHLEAAVARIVENLSQEETRDVSETMLHSTGKSNAKEEKSQEQTTTTFVVIDPERIQAQQEELCLAINQLDSAKLTSMIEHQGYQMTEETTEAAFWAVVNAVNTAEQQDTALPGDLPVILHHVFDADLRFLQAREKQTTNVTCMQPDDGLGMEGAARRMNYIFDDSTHKDLPLMEGRKCEGGECCEACSRNIFPTFASETETNLETFPELVSLTFNQLETVSAATIVQFVRLIERVRRTIAYEYGLPLKTVLPLQAYSRKYVAGTTQQGGGGGEGDFVILHTDEATHSGYHYSCVLYLSTQGRDFEGGDFVFNDRDPDYDASKAQAVEKPKEPIQILSLEDELKKELANEHEEPYMTLEEEIEKFRYVGRKLTPFHPTQGSAVIFSSGWENMHEVDKITAGTRYVVPCFFTTCPVPEAAYDQMVAGKPKTNEDIADDWLHLLLAHRHETPMESVGRVKELLMKWHYMCTPLSRH